MHNEPTRDRRFPRRRRRTAAALCGLVLAVAGTLHGMPLPAAAGAASDDAVSYRIDPAHTGAQPGDSLATPLVGRWSVDLGGAVSYPLIAGGRVFVTVADTPSYGSRLYALDPATGATLWGPVELGGTYWFSAAAYDNGRVFVVNHDGLLRAFDAATGAQAWSVTLPNQTSFTSPPTALGGVVYTGGAGSGGTVYAVSETGGALLWTQPVMNGDNSSPAVSATGVYVTYACQQDYAFDPVQGTQLWHHATGCEGGGGATPSLSGGRVYDLDSGYSPTGASTPPVVLDASTGAELGSFTADRPPAFDGGQGFFLSGGTLRGITLSSGTVNWSFAGDGSLTTAPVVAGGNVYVAGSSGMLYAVSEVSGAVTWSQTLGGTLPSSCSACPLSGLTIGEGMLVTPVGTRLAAYASMPVPVVTGVSPNAGPTAGGVTVTVSGGGFAQGVSAVRFGGVAAGSVKVVSDTQLTAVSPAQAAGTVDVTVAGAAGSSVPSTADRYTVVAPPSVTSLCPPSGTTRGGTVVTLTGTNLANVTGVRFGSAAATGVTGVSATSLTATTPAEPAGTVTVSVTTAAGGTGSGPATYTFSGARKPGSC